MKTKIAAFALLLLAGTASAAMAQDPDRRDHERGAGERPASQPSERRADPRADGGGWRGGERPAFNPAPAAPVAQEARPAPAAPQARPPMNARFGAPPPNPQPQPQARPQGDDGRRYVRRPGTWVDRDGDDTTRDLSPADRADHEDRDELRQWRRFGGGRPEGAPGPGPQNDRTHDRTNDRPNDHRDDHRGGWNGRDGDHRDGDHRDNDRRRWDNDHRDHDHDRARDNHGRPEWRPGQYPHSFRSGHRFRWRPYVRPPHFYVHVWNFGEFLPPTWFGPEYVIDDWWDFALPAPPYGYLWVRVGDDALLVDEYNGRVVQVVRDLFW